MTTLDNRKIITATKWSTIAEIGAKLIGPVSLIILARLLTPEAFGVVTTVTLVISFVEIFTDRGFQKYIIPHEFVNQKDQEESISTIRSGWITSSPATTSGITRRCIVH